MIAAFLRALIVSTAGMAAGFGIAACAGGSPSQPSSPTVSPTSVPSISGAAPTTLAAGQTYLFQPTAASLSGATLTFSIKNKPPWAVLDSGTGRLSGIPAATDAGSYPNIVLSVSDGTSTTSLPAFTIQVTSARAVDATTLAARYPGDIGIDAEPSVVWHENFAETDVSALARRYDDVSNANGMTLVADVPAASSGQHAVKMVSGGAAAATHLYKNFSSGHDELYYRYYVKYAGAGPWHHSGLWFGGYNPGLAYPYPHAGLRPAGNDRFLIGLEPQASANDPTMDFYAYWMQMRSWRANPTGAAGDYYGNSMVHNKRFAVASDAWTCFEIHLKVNPDPASGAGAVLEVWQDDSLVRRFDDTGPFGYWVADKFCPHDADGTECTTYRPGNPTLVLLDQQWRSTAALQINNVWLQNYNDRPAQSSMLYDDVVVATKRIGCTVKK